VFDAELAAGDGVDDAAVAGSVVCEDPFDGDAVAGEEGDGAAEEGGCRRGAFVEEHLGGGETAVVVDGDVDVVVADGVAAFAGAVGQVAVVVAVPVPV
jgi:hypothetical protein